MPYDAMPAKYVSLESGHLVGPNEKDKALTRVETEAIAEMAEEQKIDGSKNVVVLTVENLYRKSKNERAMEPLALKLSDCQEIVRDMLIHLACTGDHVAQFLLRSLSHATGHDQNGGEGE
jgi:hypothetical protein